MPHGKRKYSDPARQVSAKPLDATGTYSARDMQALNETFANPAGKAFLSPEQAKEGAANTQWTCGQVPPLGSSAEGEDRKDSQLAYARTLLAVFNEAVSQLAVVVDNLDNFMQRKELRVVQVHPWLLPMSRHRTKIKLPKQASSSRMPINEHAQHGYDTWSQQRLRSSNHATANMKRALEWASPCRCLVKFYRTCFWFAAAFLPPLAYLLQVRLWWDPSITRP